MPSFLPRILLLTGLVAGLHAVPVDAQTSGGARSPRDSAGRDGQRDFDWEIGTWRTQLRRLTRPLTGSSAWVAYEGTSVVRKVLDGRANLVELDVQGPAGRIEGLSLRLYNPEARQWSLNFASARTGTLSPPVLGEFKNGRGEFYGQEFLDGRAILIRFIISDVTASSARFEQAFSEDGGKTWEVNWIAVDTRMKDPCCPVIELRQYTLHPGRRDTMIELFDREFLESQEATGMRVIAQYRDIDRPDMFVWMRGFADMPARAAALSAFYGGPVWKAHKAAANATMIDSDNVLLLRPARPGYGFRLGERAPAGSTMIPSGLIVGTVYTLREPAANGFTELFERHLGPRLVASGARPVAILETEPATNTFPALPVRLGETVFVWFAWFADPAAYERHAAALLADPAWVNELEPALNSLLAGPTQVLRLTPTARSRSWR